MIPLQKATIVRTMMRLSLAVAAAALALTSINNVRADAVDDLLNANLAWRTAHPLTKCRLRQIGGDGAPFGTYYLDLRPGKTGNPAEVYVMSTRLDQAELVSRIVRESTGTRVFFNEAVYVEPVQGATPVTLGFWEAHTLADLRTSLTAIHDISGITNKTVDGVAYSGVALTLNPTKWNTFRAGVRTDFVANLPAETYTTMIAYFGPAGDLRFLEARSTKVNVEMIFYDWTDLAGAAAAEIDDVRRGPHATQERWTLPLDEATIRFIARLAR